MAEDKTWLTQKLLSFPYAHSAALVLLLITLLLVALICYALHKKRNVKAGLKMPGISFSFEANDGGESAVQEQKAAKPNPEATEARLKIAGSA